MCKQRKNLSLDVEIVAPSSRMFRWNGGEAAPEHRTIEDVVLAREPWAEETACGSGKLVNPAAWSAVGRFDERLFCYQQEAEVHAPRRPGTAAGWPRGPWSIMTRRAAVSTPTGVTAAGTASFWRDAPAGAGSRTRRGRR